MYRSHIKNSATLIREIKEKLNKWKYIASSWKTEYYKDVKSPQIAL